MSFAIRGGAFLLVVAAAAFLAVTSPDEHGWVRVLAAIVIAVPTAFALFEGLSERWEGIGRDSRLRVKRSLQQALVDIHRAGFFPGDIAEISFHVWIVPRWYRRFLPYRLRRRFGPAAQRLPMWTRPTLVRHSIFRFAHHQSAEVGFRKGVGVVGRCIERNHADEAMIVALDSPSYRRALRTDEAWANAPLRTTQGLSRLDAERLSRSYGQVAAIVLRETRGEAIGCITLDLPPQADPRLVPKPKAGSPEALLLASLKGTKSAVENHLTRKGH